MTRLIKADLIRLRKNLPFFICLIAIAVISVVDVFDMYMDEQMYGNEINGSLKITFFWMYVTLASSAIIGLFTGSDYSDGTIRNKVVAGCNRSKIYLSHLFVNFCAMLLMSVVYIVIQLVVGFILFKNLDLDLKETVVSVGLNVLAIAVACAILTLIVMLIGNKAVSCIICILTVFLLLMAGISINQRLEEPEMRDIFKVTNEETMEMDVITEPNPLHLLGKKREAYEFASMTLPVGQMYANTFLAVDWKAPAASVTWTAVVTCIGVCLFKKKNIR